MEHVGSSRPGFIDPNRLCPTAVAIRSCPKPWHVMRADKVSKLAPTFLQPRQDDSFRLIHSSHCDVSEFVERSHA